MPRQVSKCITVMLFDDEVEAWQILQGYLLQKANRSDWSQPNDKKVTTRRMIRELMRLAAEHVAVEIGPEIAEKLSSPPPLSDFLVRRSARQRSVKPAAKARGRKPGKKPDPKPTQRIHWNRRSGTRMGDAE